MRIGVDIDEILTPLLESFLPFYNERHGTDYRLEDIWTYHLEEVMERPLPEMVEDVRDFYESGLLVALQPFPDAQEAIKALKDAGHELVIITSRHSGAIEKTKPWLDKHFPGMFSTIHFSKHVGWSGEEKTKGTLCKELKVNVLIDDDARYSKDCEECNITLVLLDKPWNQRQETNGALRVKDWQEVLEKIEELGHKGS